MTISRGPKCLGTKGGRIEALFSTSDTSLRYRKDPKRPKLFQTEDLITTTGNLYTKYDF
jgi:hypothetical protein